MGMEHLEAETTATVSTSPAEAEEGRASDDGSDPIMTVVVCTYDRPQYLARTLCSLAAQAEPPDRYEVLVVDNGGRGDIGSIVESARGSCGPPMRVVAEPRPGLGHARNTGVLRARGRYVGFIDDDAVACTDWVAEAIRCFESVSPRPWAVGGPVHPIFAGERPHWFKDEYESDSWGPRARFLKNGESFSGNNMFILRSILLRFGGFDLEGMSGDRMQYGEETAFFLKVWESEVDAPFFYSPNLVVGHEIPEYKTTVGFILKRAFNSGQSWWLPLRRSPAVRIKGAARSAAFVVARVGIAASRFFRYPYREQWLAESVAPVSWEVGRLLGAFGLFPRVRQRALPGGE